MNGKSTRAKGAAFERKAANVFIGAGLQVRSLQRNLGGEADVLVMAGGRTYSVECKNQARLQLPAWWDQAVVCAPNGSVPLLTFNRHGEMLSVLRTEDLARLLAGGAA